MLFAMAAMRGVVEGLGKSVRWISPGKRANYPGYAFYVRFRQDRPQKELTV
jgi:hypothetical protein